MPKGKKAGLTRAQLLKRMGKIRLLSLDVDGILTDGGIYYLDDGQQVRKFNSKDGMGLKEVLKAGIDICWVTASNTASILHRARALGVPHILSDVEDKLEALKGLINGLGIELSEVAHMGDDINDLPVLKAVGLPITAADGVLEVRKVAVHITGKAGGDGAVREVCDLLVASRRRA
jgi:3-deoxy-D-manno-octulosonate 8-phosphate phosphatase (KDO 8-P phosphatase)